MKRFTKSGIVTVWALVERINILRSRTGGLHVWKRYGKLFDHAQNRLDKRVFGAPSRGRPCEPVFAHSRLYCPIVLISK